jgi:phosphonate transport system substrate-binding protein
MISLNKGVFMLNLSVLKRLLILVLVFSFNQFSFSDEITELNFCIIATESTAGLKKGFDPFLKELSNKLNVKIKAFFAPDYAGIIEGMRFKKVHVAWFGNKSAIEAVDRAGGEVFAQTTGSDGSLGYYSLIIVHRDSPYKSIDDIISNGNNLVFGNGDPNSTSGYLIPTYYIWSKKGIDPKKHFKRVRNANHEANCLAVASKQVDFSTNNTESMKRFKSSNPKQFNNIRIIWKSPVIPKDPLVWRKDLPREWKTKLQAVILSFGRIGHDAKKELKILNNISGGWGPFLESDNRQLLPIRELKVEKDRLKLVNNSKINEDQKKLRLGKIVSLQQNLQKHIELVQYWNSVKEN